MIQFASARGNKYREKLTGLAVILQYGVVVEIGYVEVSIGTEGKSGRAIQSSARYVDKRADGRAGLALVADDAVRSETGRQQVARGEGLEGSVFVGRGGLNDVRRRPVCILVRSGVGISTDRLDRPVAPVNLPARDRVVAWVVVAQVDRVGVRLVHFVLPGDHQGGRDVEHGNACAVAVGIVVVGDADIDRVAGAVVRIRMIDLNRALVICQLDGSIGRSVAPRHHHRVRIVSRIGEVDGQFGNLAFIDD